jgi:hypothetical protein
MLWTDDSDGGCSRHVNAHKLLKLISPQKGGVKRDLGETGRLGRDERFVGGMRGSPRRARSLRRPGSYTRRKRRSDSPDPTADTSTAAPRSTATSAENAIVRGAAISVQ